MRLLEVVVTVWVPEKGEKVTVERVVEKVTVGVTNLPPIGTRISATLGFTRIVGTVTGKHSEYEQLHIALEGQEDFFDETHSCWFGSGWVFEVLEEGVVG